mgnify:FL=1
MMIGDYMKTKEKKEKKVKITIKNLIYFLVFIVFMLYSILFYNLYFSKEVYATEETASQNTEKIKISHAEDVNLEEIISQNTNDGQREEYEVREEVLEYITKYRTNTSIPKGVVQVVQEGRQGTQEVTVKKTYKDETLVNEEQVSQKITKASINKVVEIGGGTGTSNYKVKVGDTLYVTSDRLSVMVEPDENSQKVATLSQNDELELKEIKDSWYKIESGTARGYVKAECTTYINPNAQNEEEYTNEGSSNEKSASTLKSTLSFNMALNKPSGLSLDQFKKVLTDSKDKNNIFANNAEYFYYIEKQYNINGIFVAAVGIHESGWGTSKISLEKKNLFGYGAYDSNPYNSAYHFSDYSESIDLLARVFVKYYLNPKGTSIYGGEVATGSYYNGATLTGVNTKYATDKNWANRVYQHMQYLYNKL